MEKTLIVENLTKTFRLSKKQMRIDKTKNNLKVAVDDISFYTNRGEIFGLLGPNGAGKTTTLRCVATLIKPDSGNITIAGIDVKDEVAVKKRIAFLTNELKLDEQFTPNYLFNYFSYFHNIDNATVEKRKKELFDKFEINQFSEIKIGELSTGMKQKVSIVMALVHDPEIIIFDEPTNGLDVIVARTVTNYLKELRDRGKTVIISTHIMGLVQKICDRVGIIIDGRLVLCDTVENVISMSPNKDIEDVFFDIYSQETGEE